MTIKTPPKYVLHILNNLETAGYEAFMAGGCVRDALMGRVPNDYDIATDAPPEAVMSLFSRTVPTGVRHGTVTVLYGGGSCEVTTYRLEGRYTDHRRPDSVRFTSRLEDDLSRRDFTINAMAMDVSGRITDPFGGRRDIGQRLIRCVGEAEKRFSEDALRMFRALRFAAKLGFEIEAATLEAIYGCSPLAENLSAERVSAELRGILASPGPDRIWGVVQPGLLNRFLRSGSCNPHPLAPLPLYARLARWCADLESGGLIMSTDSFLSALRFSTHERKKNAAAAEILRSGSRDYKRLLRDFGPEAVLAAYPKSRRLRQILRSGECCSRGALAISGKDLLALGYSGSNIRDKLDELVEHVIDCPEDNKREILCKLAMEDII